MGMKKRVLQIGFFFLVMGLTFYTLFYGQDLWQIQRAVLQMSPVCLILAAGLALFFVSAEGTMIWYLLRSMEGKSGLMRCIAYSFIGFFYSGITPSATGGQPVQLYYMKKDGNRVSDSTVVLMTVALIYKFVLVGMGIGLLLFWYGQLKAELKGYFLLYLIGLSLNILVVVLILSIMLVPHIIKKAAAFFVRLGVRMKVMKPSIARQEKLEGFVENYQRAVQYLFLHKKKIFIVIGITFLQRVSLFVLTYMVYLGLGIHGTGGYKVILLQACIYIAVDMLPLPGSQGITELMYKTVFLQVFSSLYLIPSMLISRGLNFYFLLIVSFFVVIWNQLKGRNRQGSC